MINPSQNQLGTFNFKYIFGSTVQLSYKCTLDPTVLQQQTGVPHLVIKNMFNMICETIFDQKSTTEQMNLLYVRFITISFFACLHGMPTFQVKSDF